MNSLQRRIKYLAIISTLGMLLLLIGGALVTKTDSGDGCGSSWPLCHGQFIPTEINLALLIELSHRIMTGFVSLLVVTLIYLSWKYMHNIPERKFLSILAIAFIIVQSLIGALTVLFGQSDFFLALHFGISLISFAAVLLLSLLILEVDKKFTVHTLYIDNHMRKNIIAVTLYSLVVIYTGALVRHMEASMICPSWPLCNNRLLSLPQNLYEWAQMGHRVIAGFLFLWILYITTLAIKNYRTQPVMYYGWITAFILVSLQVVTGALTIFTRLNLFIALLHALFISCLFGLLSYMIFVIYRTRHNEDSQNSINNIKTIIDSRVNL